MTKKFFKFLLLLSILFLFFFQNSMLKTSATVNSENSTNGQVWLDYTNHTMLTNNGVIAPNANLLAFSNHTVNMGFIFVNGTQVATLEDWQVYLPSTPGTNLKIVDGNAGDYNHPFSVILQPNIDPYIINLTIFDTQCNVKSISYVENTNGDTNQPAMANPTTNSISISDYHCVPNNNVPLLYNHPSTQTTTSSTPGFEPIMLLFAVFVMVLIRKKKF